MTRFLVFFSIVVLVLVGGHVFVAWRVTASMEERPKRYLRLFVLSLPLLTLLPVALRLVGGVESALADGLAWVGWGALGFSSLLFTVTMIRDGFYLLFRIGQRAAGRELVSAERRQALMASLGYGQLGVSGALLGYGVLQVTGGPPVREVTVPIAGLPDGLDGFRIVQLTDIHVGPTIRREQIERMARLATEAKPDLVVLTGDIVDGSVDYLRDDVAPLGTIESRHGTFVCTGNHEYYAGVHEWVAHFRDIGLNVLLNEHEIVEHGDARLVLAGVTDYSAASREADHATSPQKAIAGAPEHDLSILLAHQPRSIHEAHKAGFDLQLSGHTHGGQFFPWNFFVHLAQPYVAGLHDHDGTLIYVSRGSGYWGPPVRIGAPAEITLLVLKRAPIA